MTCRNRNAVVSVVEVIERIALKFYDIKVRQNHAVIYKYSIMNRTFIISYVT